MRTSGGFGGLGAGSFEVSCNLFDRDVAEYYIRPEEIVRFVCGFSFSLGNTDRWVKATEANCLIETV